MASDLSRHCLHTSHKSILGLYRLKNDLHTYLPKDPFSDGFDNDRL